MTNIKPYSGRTWVGFLDLSGFKNEMRKGPNHTKRMLHKFYNSIYDYHKLYSRRNSDWNTIELNVLSVSDCAIIFSKNNSRFYQDKTKGLITLLLFVRGLNRNLIRKPHPRILTTCSICYGDFYFESREENDGLDKEFFYGDAYLQAYLDHSNIRNKIHVGDCRVRVDESIDVSVEDSVFDLLKQEGNYYYYYWMLNNPTQIDGFKREYNIELYEYKKDVLNQYIR